MILALLAAPLAHAHGGETHETAGAPARLAYGEEVRVLLPGDVTEGVLRVRGDDGERELTVMLADTETSAPRAASGARLSLSGPASVEVPLAAGSPGELHGHASLLEGVWAGTLVTSGAPAELLAVPQWTLAATPHAHAEPAGAGAWPWIALGAGVLGLGLGRVLGSRRAAGMGALALVVAASGRAGAHGGEDHGALAAQAFPVGGSIELRMEAQFLVGLRTARARAGESRLALQVVGYVSGGEAGPASLRAPVAGTIRWAASARPGRPVRAGELLYTVEELLGASDRASRASGLADARTARASAQAALRIARRDVDALATLGDAATARERTQREAALEAAEAGLRAAEAALEILQAGARVEVRAPRAGRLAAREAPDGEAVLAGDSVGRILSDGGAPWVVAQVPASAGVVVGGSAQVEAGGRMLPARVLEAGAELDRVSGSRRVTLALGESGAGVLPGAPARVWIELDAAPTPALLVPAAAVHDPDAQPYVVEKVGTEAFVVRPVRVGPLEPGPDGAQVRPVFAGLADGARVVVAGAAALRSAAGR